ncbi:hypothetical protein [Nocardia canadensis]|uniref:hypothetical protein n=1 Tax=Nocardia canadensis TaxID=3065238 RepID=UPI002931CF94|nr:hypothetical protein [Nocardia canadensis]
MIDLPDTAGRTMKVTVFPPDTEEFGAARIRQLAERHLPLLARPDAVVDYRVVRRTTSDIRVLVGGCLELDRDTSPESAHFARRYQGC